MNITVISNQLSENEIKRLQIQAEALNRKGYTISELQKKLGKQNKVSVSVAALDGEDITLRCRPC